MISQRPTKNDINASFAPPTLVNKLKESLNTTPSTNVGILEGDESQSFVILEKSKTKKVEVVEKFSFNLDVKAR